MTSSTSSNCTEPNLAFPDGYPPGQLLGAVDIVDCLTQEDFQAQVPPYMVVPAPTRCVLVFILQWNLSIKDIPNTGHLSNEDTVCSPNHIELLCDQQGLARH